MSITSNPDRLEDLRAEYAQTGMVTSDGAVWLFSQVVVLREQVQRLSASSAVSVVPSDTNQTEAGQAGEDQPETPLEKRLRYSERRNDELRAESLRRGKVNLEYAEKIVALERQIDEVRSQLGAEILRAGQAEAELRRMAAEAPHTATPDEAVVETHVRYQVQLRHQGDADWKTSHPRVDFEDRERAEASAALSRELFPRREYRVVTRTTTITKAPAVVAQPGKEV